MNYIGIDIAKNVHVAAVRDEGGKLCGSPIAFGNCEEGFVTLLRFLGEQGCDSGRDIVAMESTGHYWMALWSYLAERGWRLALVNPLQTDAFRKVGTIRKTKTDKVDAPLIAEFARFKHVEPSPVSPEDTEGLKQLTRYRSHVVAERTALMNRGTALADRVFPELETLFTDRCKSKAFRAVFRELGTPAEIAKTDIRTIERVIREASGGIHGRQRAEQVKELAKKSVGLRFSAGTMTFELAHVLDLVDRLDTEVAEIDAECRLLLERTSGQVLTAIPGISTVTAAAIAAEVGDPFRFETPSKLVAFAGMDASVRQSGKFTGESKMSKRGSRYLRYHLMFAAENVRRFDPYFGDYYDSLKARGKHHLVALSGVARKLCGVVLALMKDQRPYERRESVQSQANGAATCGAGEPESGS